MQKSNHRPGRHLLRPRRERPRACRTAEQRDELATPDHSITSSARASTFAGTSRPSALAATTLMTSSYLVGIACAVAHQTAGQDKLANTADCRHAMTRGERCQLPAPGVKKDAATDK